MNACRVKKLSPIWTPVHDDNKGVNISMLMKHVLCRSVNWPTCQVIIIGWPHNQNVFLIIVLHGVCCQGSRLLTCLDSTFHCQRGTALNQVEALKQYTSKGKSEICISRLPSSSNTNIMNIEDNLSRSPVFLDSNHFHNCELIIKIFTGLCKCPHESMIKTKWNTA